VNLPETKISNEISFILNGDENVASSYSHNRNKEKLLEHIYSGIDVILITSSQQENGSLFLEQCFKDNSDKIRTIFLNSDSFPKDDSELNNSSHDLSMISAVVYESIHLDTHFAIIVNGADQIPFPILNELIRLALAINSSKNNVNFIFSGGTGLLGVIQQISDITRLGLTHCSLDKITEEDISDFIDDKQSECIESRKLKFNKYALKKISSYAKGSLYNASTLLEWCRLYAIHTDNYKVTAGFIDELLTNSECNQFLSGYPAAGFSFSASTQAGIKDDENVEFTKKDAVQTQQPTPKESSRTVYIDETSTDTEEHADKEQKNIFEKVMATTSGDVVSIDSSVIMDVTLAEENHRDDPDPAPESNSDTEYEDTYQLEALRDINTPLSPTYADEDTLPATPAKLTKASSNATNSAFIWTVLVLMTLIGSYYLYTANLISYTDVRTYIGTVLSSNDVDKSETISNVSSNPVPVPAPPVVNIEDQYKQKITALIELAESQIDQKKLSTPPSDNAMETYQLVLELDPGNKSALAGIDLIKERYQTWARLDIKDGNTKRAIYFLQRAIEISPDEEALNLLADLQ
tara:strand:+ start:739 stop:2475 length:1737 start_codon:yes stop_codon:yes gene_type:complete